MSPPIEGTSSLAAAMGPGAPAGRRLAARRGAPSVSGPSVAAVPSADPPPLVLGRAGGGGGGLVRVPGPAVLAGAKSEFGFAEGVCPLAPGKGGGATATLRSDAAVAAPPAGDVPGNGGGVSRDAGCAVAACGLMEVSCAITWSDCATLPGEATPSRQSIHRPFQPTGTDGRTQKSTAVFRSCSCAPKHVRMPRPMRPCQT